MGVELRQLEQGDTALVACSATPNLRGTMEPTSTPEDDEQPSQNPWRNEIVRTIFGDVGTIRKDFSCAVERKILLHGRMYVTDKFICFYSNLFGFEKKIKIPYSHITCVTKEYTAVFIPNAIAVITAKREYFFRSFWDRDEAFQLLKECHEQSRSGASSSSSSLFGSLGDHTDGRRAPRDRAVSAGHVPSADRRDSRAERNSRSPARIPGLSRDSGRRMTMGTTKSSSMLDTGVAQHQSSSEPLLSSREEEEEEDEKEISTRSQLDPETAFTSAREGRTFKYRAVTVDFAMSLDDFFHVFLSKEATMGLPKFHQVKGDSEVEVEDWSANTSNNPDIRKHLRTFRFRTPIIGAPIGPSSTRGTKTQCCQVFNGNGIVVETVTHLEDIPYGDCFNVEDRWVVTPMCKADGSPGVRLDVVFEITWMKSTFWKGTIESKTKSDMTDFFTRCTDAMTNHLRTERPPAGRESPKGPTTAAPPTSPKAQRAPSSPRRERPSQREFLLALAPWILLLLALALNIWFLHTTKGRDERLLKEVRELRQLVEAQTQPGGKFCS